MQVQLENAGMTAFPDKIQSMAKSMAQYLWGQTRLIRREREILRPAIEFH
jgi:hypothetical protein